VRAGPGGRGWDGEREFHGSEGFQKASGDGSLLLSVSAQMIVLIQIYGGMVGGVAGATDAATVEQDGGCHALSPEATGAWHLALFLESFTNFWLH